eukprot:gene21491-biopygen17658
MCPTPSPIAPCGTCTGFTCAAGGSRQCADSAQVDGIGSLGNVKAASAPAVSTLDGRRATAPAATLHCPPLRRESHRRPPRRRVTVHYAHRKLQLQCPDVLGARLAGDSLPVFLELLSLPTASIPAPRERVIPDKEVCKRRPAASRPRPLVPRLLSSGNKDTHSSGARYRDSHGVSERWGG